MRTSFLKNAVLLMWVLLPLPSESRYSGMDVEGEDFTLENQRASPHQLSYDRALSLAQKNQVNLGVIDAMRREHTQVEVYGKIEKRVEVKVNLGVALMQLGNAVSDPMDYSLLYDESESIFVSALKLHPGHNGAEQNLASVRKNRSLRPRLESKVQSQQQLDHMLDSVVETAQPSESEDEFVDIDVKDDSSAMSYEEAMQKAMQGQLDMTLVKAMRRELQLAEFSGQIQRQIELKVNLGTLLLNLGNQADNRNIAEFLSSYLESQKILESALIMEPTNPRATSNLAIVKRNIVMRERLKLLNPHLTSIGARECKQVALQRLQKEQLSATLFTCDNREDGGLIWTYHAAHTDAADWVASFRDRAKSRREMAYDTRSLMWRDDLCWIAAVADWVKDTEYMLFHCVDKDQFLKQMVRSRNTKEILPLIHVRGGMILADRLQQTEKNWSPFVVGNVLYITYRTRPHIVMKCDWEEGHDQLRCHIVQNVEVDSVPNSWGSDDLRGSSTAISLPGADYLAMGHMKSSGGDIKYKFYLYKFSGKGAPFKLTAFSRLFTILPPNATFQYAHGLCLDEDSITITYGLGDDASWFVKLPLSYVMSLFQPEKRPQVSPTYLVSGQNWSPKEFVTTLFGEDVESNFMEMENKLKHSSHPLAQKVIAFLRESVSLPLDIYFTEAQKFIQIYLDSNAGLEDFERRCVVASNGDFSEGACSRDERARSDAQVAFWAYIAILTRENRVVRAILSRGEAFLPDNLSKQLGDSVTIKRLERAVTRKRSSEITYSEAMHIAQSGKVNKAVVDAMRREVAYAEKNKPIYYRIEVNINLGVALMQLGNQEGIQSAYSKMYKESEESFLAALSLHPGHTGAEKNLAIVRRNHELRTKTEKGGEKFRTSSVRNAPDRSIPKTQMQAISKKPLHVETTESIFSDLDDPEGDEHDDDIQSELLSSHAHTKTGTGVASSVISYADAVRDASKKVLSESVIQAMRREHGHAEKKGDSQHLISTKVNLATALMNRANVWQKIDPVQSIQMRLESRNLLDSALQLDPGSQEAAKNLAILRHNIAVVQSFKLADPQVVKIGDNFCDYLLLRRIAAEHFTSHLLTCDSRTDRGLLWIYNDDFEQRKPIFMEQGIRVFVEDVKTVVWRDEICWISSALLQGSSQMQFHCVRKDRFLRQIERAHRQQKLLPLLHVRGGLIESDRQQRVEKNWSPFVVGDRLYMTYSTQPHIVMECERDESHSVLMCSTVQHFLNHFVPDSWGVAYLRSSSTGIPWQGRTDEFLALGRVLNGRYSGHHFFYKFIGQGPPFQLSAVSKLFKLLPESSVSAVASVHGIHLDSEKVVISYSVEDASSWHFKVPVKSILSLFDEIEVVSSFALVSMADEVPMEFPSLLFGRSIASVFDEMSTALKKSAHSVARKAVSLLERDQSVSASLDSYLNGFSEFKNKLTEAIADFETHEVACEDESSSGNSLRNCLEKLNRVGAMTDLENSFIGYASLLSHETSIVTGILERDLPATISDDFGKVLELSNARGLKFGRFISNNLVSAKKVKSVRKTSQSGKKKSSAKSTGALPDSQVGNDSTPRLSYSDALTMAQAGRVDNAVVSAFRREHEEAEENGPANYLVEVKINLGVALMQQGNQAAEPGTYTRMYDESESVLVSALALDPAHINAEKNLAVVRSNRQVRQAGDNRSPKADFSVNNPNQDTGYKSEEQRSSTRKRAKKSGKKKVQVNIESDDDDNEMAVKTEGHDSNTIVMPYTEALELAMKGIMNQNIIDSFRGEHRRAHGAADTSHLVTVKNNLGAALLNFANHAMGSLTILESYLESERVLKSALELDPGSERALSNLKSAQANIFHRQRFEIFNPHMLRVGDDSCTYVVVRRMEKGQLTTTLFTCDDRTDRGLVWISDAEDISAEEWNAAFRQRRVLRRSLAEDARTVLWRDEVCWISGAVLQDGTYMQFHCVRKDRFSRQMERTHRQQKLLPLLHVRGGLIKSDRRQRVEKNWSPFVVGTRLYMTYSTQPHIVMECDWDLDDAQRLRCNTVQQSKHDLVPSSYGGLNLRGSSTGVPLPGAKEDFLAVGHMKDGLYEFRFFFYKFSGSQPPFRVTAFSRLFRVVSPETARLQYVHGLSIEAGQLTLAFGLGDDASWSLRLSLRDALALFRPEEAAKAAPALLTAIASELPTEFPVQLFGRPLEGLLQEIRDGLRLSDREAARMALAVLEEPAALSLEDYVASAFEQKAMFLDAVRALEMEEEACEGRSGGAAAVRCLSDLGESDAMAEAETATAAYTALLAEENLIVKVILEREDEGGGRKRGRPKTRAKGKGKRRRKRRQEADELAAAAIGGGVDAALPYSEAMRRARAGQMDAAIVDAIRREHAALLDGESRAHEGDRLFEVTVNLGVALMELGNRVKDPAEYGALYDECEEVLLSVLRQIPGHAGAEQNLAKVRHNRKVRRQ